MHKDSRTPTLIQLMVHGGMGVELGALLGIALMLTDHNIFQFIVTSSSPLGNMAVFLGFFSFVIGVGATISGFFFTTIELNELKAKQQTKKVNQWRRPDNPK